ncbi:MAG TPA: hypothetical protein VK081_07570 [Planctomycetota bacterium]|nr:hypothetical protein [Planctomycetota bacterium]
MTDVRPLSTPPVVPVHEPAAGAPPSAGTATFRRLLETLEGLAKAPPPQVADADDLQRALRRADADYALASELRRRLEDAIRQGR